MSYVDSRFAHPNWDPQEPNAPDSFDGTIPVVWKDVRYLHCGQSHIFMSAWTIKDSTFQTEQYGPWGEYWFYASIYTGALGRFFALLPPTPVPEDVLAISVFRDFVVKDSVFIGGDTSAGLDITLSPAEEVQTQGGDIVIKDNRFLDTEGDGFSMWTGWGSATYTGGSFVGVEVKDNVFDNVWYPMTFYTGVLPPIEDLVVKDNLIIP